MASNRRWTSDGYAAAMWDELNGNPGAVKRYLSDAPAEGFTVYRCAACSEQFLLEAAMDKHIKNGCRDGQ